jgi:hypothetical protein
LISLWSTAPFLLNNTVGPFDPSPSIDARMKVFQVSIEQMLWPERRELDAVLGAKGVGMIQRTTHRSWLRVPAGFLPGVVTALHGPLNWLLPGAFTENGDLRLGPIPKGTPIGLLGNLDLLPEDRGLVAGLARAWKLIGLGLRMRHDLAALPTNADDAAATDIFTPLGRELYSLSACPDYVVNRGHYFGTDMFAEEPGLSDADKRALIEFLKTF